MYFTVCVCVCARSCVDEKDLWHLEVIQPMRERNPDSNMEESFAPELRESLLDDED